MKLLSEPDVPLLRSTLLRDPYYNLFMIGDLDQMGIDHPDLYYWGQYVAGEMVGVAMRYRGYWMFYDAGGADLGAFALVVDEYPASRMLNGREPLVLGVCERLSAYEVTADRRCFFCALPMDAQLPAPVHATREARPKDIPALVELYATADTMRRDAASIKACIKQNRIYVTVVGDRLVSVALSNVETDAMAMVGGVFTPEPLRKRGYASAAITALCASLLHDGIQPCLFYDDPAAGSIYRRLGFEDIGRWRMVTLDRT